MNFFKMLLVCACVCPLDAADAGMFRGDAAHSGVYESASPALTSVKWKFETRAKVISSPVVFGGVVYFGSADHRSYAVNASDGSLRWKFAAKGPVDSSPAVTETAVYVASLDGNFYAVERESGKLKWQFKTDGERRFTAPGMHGMIPRTEMIPDPFDVFLSSPAVAGGMVYFGSGDHNVYALDAETGKLQWKFATGNVVHASPAIADGVLYIGSWDRYLYALNAKSGALMWKFQTGDDTEIYNQIGIASSAAVAGGTVYFGCRDAQLYALDAKTGAIKWHHDNNKGWVIASPAVYGGNVYFPTSDGARFKALNGTTGELIFSLQNKEFSYSSPAITRDTAYFGTADGWLHAVDLKSGKIRSEFQTDGSHQNSAKFINDKGKFRDDLYPDGTLEGIIVGLNRMYTLGSVLSSPVVSGGVVYFGSTDGHVYAVN